MLARGFHGTVSHKFHCYFSRMVRRSLRRWLKSKCLIHRPTVDFDSFMNNSRVELESPCCFGVTVVDHACDFNRIARSRFLRFHWRKSESLLEGFATFQSAANSTDFETISFCRITEVCERPPCTVKGELFGFGIGGDSIPKACSIDQPEASRCRTVPPVSPKNAAARAMLGKLCSPTETAMLFGFFFFSEGAMPNAASFDHPKPIRLRTVTSETLCALQAARKLGKNLPSTIVFFR